jgi:hypothetical protein
MERPASPPIPDEPPPPPRAYWLCAAFVLVGLCLRLPFLGRSVWFDEACMSDQRLGTFEQLLATLYVDIHPPLYVTFMHFWNGLFGDSEVSMRLPPLLCGLLTIPAMFWAGRWFVGDTAALWGALLMALSPVHVWYSAEARLYAPMVLCTLVLVGTFERLTSGRSPRRRLLWTLHLGNLAVMLLLHYYLAVFVVLLAALAPIATRGFTTTARRLWIAHGIGLLLLGGFVLAKRALGHFETEQGYMRALDLPGLFQLVFDWCWTGHTLAAVDHPLDRTAAFAQQALGVLLLGSGLWRVFRARTLHPQGLFVPVFLLTIPGFLLGAAGFGLANTYIERSCLPMLPFVFLLAGAGLVGLPRRAYLPTGAAALVLCTASLIALFEYRDSDWTVYKPNSDWRSATQWLGAEIDAGGAGRPVFTSTPNPRPLSYYDVRIQDVKNLTDATDPARIGDAVGRRLGAWFGSFAAQTFQRFADHNARLLQGASLRVYRSAADPAALDLPRRMRDDICYVVRDEWHPPTSIDRSVEDLLQHPRITVLETHRFSGITVYKVRIAP